MNKAELIERSPASVRRRKEDAEKVVNAFIETVQSAVAVDDKVTLPGFGAWSRSQRTARHRSQPAYRRARQHPGLQGRQVLGGSQLQESR